MRKHDSQAALSTETAPIPVHVNKIEEAALPLKIKGNTEPLPGKVNINRVIDLVSKNYRAQREQSLKLSMTNLARPKLRPFVDTKWNRYFSSDENIAIISDFFWYGVARLIPPSDNRPQEDVKAIKQGLLNRIACNYIELLLSVDVKYKDIFFKTYYDSIAQAVLFSYFFAYPKSRALITSENFISRLFEIISKKITGVPICSQSYEKWELNLMAENILKEKPIVSSTLPELNKQRHYKKHLLNMRYSPLVERYMQMRKYEGLNLVKNWQIGYSLRNLQDQRKVTAKMQRYRMLAKKSVDNTKKEFASYEQKSKQIDRELRENKIHTSQFIQLLNERTNEIRHQNEREYSNMLVSLRLLWRNNNR